MAFIIYFLAIKKTIVRKTLCNDLQEQLLVVENAPEQMTSIRTELKKVESVIGKESKSGVNFRQMVLEKTSHYCEQYGILIKDIPEPIVMERNDYEIMTHTITLQGGFHDLIKFLFELEKYWSLGNISSAKFHTEKKIRTKQNYLYISIYLQNVRKKQN
ncbi:MAG: hypothetical protein K8R68_06155 [Bacteroidales bacterium]|nr:hypothetical protein [Bacteroidales bacterium]